jgi:hypothetical protein
VPGTPLCVKNCNAAGFFHALQFPVCMENDPPDNLTQLWEPLESTWASIPVECFRHLVESVPQRIEAVLRAKRGVGVQLNIRKVCIESLQDRVSADSLGNH